VLNRYSGAVGIAKALAISGSARMGLRNWLISKRLRQFLIIGVNDSMAATISVACSPSL